MGSAAAVVSKVRERCLFLSPLVKGTREGITRGDQRLLLQQSLLLLLLLVVLLLQGCLCSRGVSPGLLQRRRQAA